MSPTQPAALPHRGPAPISAALVTAAVATMLVALWLGFTALTVLPAHDPTRVRFWLLVAAGFLVFAVVSVAGLRPGRSGAIARAAAGVLGVAAAGLGVGAIVRVVSGGTPFEGYLLLMGAVLALHGLLALLHVLTPAGPGSGEGAGAGPPARAR